TGRGYWFVAADGGIFSFGDAGFFGSTGAIKLVKPIVGMAASPTGRGYWFVASDGGIFNYGDAAFFGSAAGASLRSPIVSMAATPSGKGYFLASADGTVHAFGDAVFRGSMGGKALTSPIVGLAPTSTGAGYWLVAADGGIFSFGDAGFYGSTGNLRLNRAIVGMAAAPQKTAGGSTTPTSPGATNTTLPGGGTDTTLPGGGTTDTTTPGGGTPGSSVWGPAGATYVVAKAGGGGNAYRPWMSEDGRYLVFDSDGKRVMGGTADPVGIRDIYLYDRTGGTMERISVGVGGARAHIPEADASGACSSAPCGSQRPTISADGRYVAWWSSADNLVAGDTNGHADAFLRDRQTGTTTLLSKGFQNTQSDGDSKRPIVSRDGHYVAFESAAANLISPAKCGFLDLSCKALDTNKADDIFLYDVTAGSLTRVSTGTDGTQGNGASDRASLSGNGRKILFASAATNFIANDANGAVTDIFMRDLATGQTTLVSASAAGVQSDKASESPSISADGRWVSFDTKATNLNCSPTCLDTGGDTDVYVKDLQTGAIDQVSVQSGGAQATGTNGSTVVGGDSSISSDGRYVAFWSNASTLVPNDTNGSACKIAPCADVFVR
ncbi:MAG TPA: hypothetical protein VGR20_08990, partial [Acidimicrobiia bacterium]|nr:hypothetical protein [Acidimicrobiia bacterium]